MEVAREKNKARHRMSVLSHRLVREESLRRWHRSRGLKKLNDEPCGFLGGDYFTQRAWQVQRP